MKATKRQLVSYLVKIYLIVAMIIMASNLLAQFVYFNPSSSEVQGYYFVYKTNDYQVGDTVLLCITDKRYVTILHQLGLPYASDSCNSNMPYLLKRIVAKAGDKITINQHGMVINNKLQMTSLSYNYYHGLYLRPFKVRTKLILKDGQYLVLGIGVNSYDSRYFGIVYKHDIHYRAILLWQIAKPIWARVVKS